MLSMIRLYRNGMIIDELERTWRGEMSSNFPAGTKENIENLNQDSRFPDPKLGTFILQVINYSRINQLGIIGR
jgi:hypothetical protein